MPEIKPQKTIHQSFLELPEKVRDWLTSERATYTIIEINKKLDLFGSLLSVIPNLITRLVTKNLDPRNFTKELGDGLGLDDDQAKQVTQEIVEKILRPIDLPLKEAGVFIGTIYGGPTPPSAPAPVIAPALRSFSEGGNEVKQYQSKIATALSEPRNDIKPKSPPVPPLIATKEMAHPEPPQSIQSKVIPIPIKRPQNNMYGNPPTP